jgi:transposase-like protein
MEDYPRTLQEFEARFSTEEGCRDYLFQLRWPQGFRCPRCGGRKAWPVRATLFQCSSCDCQTSVTAGTVFQDTRKPLATWFRAMWFVTSQKNGASALGLQRVLGLGSYRTAWSWLHKLRRAMVRSGRDRLAGWVEVDETYLGSEEEGVIGRGAIDKALIVIAAQADGKGIGRIRMRVIQHPSAANLHPFVEDSIERGSTVHTDGWKGYAGLNKKGYDHEVTPIRKRPKEASALMPRVHLVASLLKRWLAGTHQGGVSHEHLPYYLDEFAFRFNRRKSKSRGKLFFRLVQQAVDTAPTTYARIAKPAGSLRSQSQPVGAT